MLSNARSLAPKIDSFIENFNERDIDLCVITETWLHDEMGILQDDGVPLSLGEGIGVVHAGRPVGRRGGGVGIFFRKSKMKVVDITPSLVSHSEIAVSLCSVRGLSRKIVCVGAYLTTALDERGAEAFLEKINYIIHQIKSKYVDPVIIVAGDWNRADTGIALLQTPGLLLQTLIVLSRCQRRRHEGTKCWTSFSLTLDVRFRQRKCVLP